MTRLTIRQRFGVAIAVGISGGIVAAAITQAGGAMFRDWGFVRVATGGAFLAGLLVAPGFGGQGTRGWFMSGLSFGAATVLGAIFAVMLLPLEDWLAGLDVFGAFADIAGISLMGPAFVIGMSGQDFSVLAGWVATLAAAHTAARALRR